MPAAEVVDEDALALMLRRFVDERRRGRFVDDPDHLQPGDLARLARRLPLRVGEIRGHGDHRLAHRPPQALLRDRLEPRQDDRRDFLRRVSRSPQTDLGVAAHPPLDRADRPLGIQQELVARRLTDQQFPGFRQPDHGGQDDPSLLVAEHLRASVPVDGDFRIGGAEIDADDLVRHARSPLPAPPLLTITSAVRNTCSSQQKAGADLLDHGPVRHRSVRDVATTRDEPRVERPADSG